MLTSGCIIFDTPDGGSDFMRGNVGLKKGISSMMLTIRLQNTLAERNERGAAMAEYGLLLALVALAAIVVLAAFGDSISSVFQSADNRLQEGIADAAGTTPATP